MGALGMNSNKGGIPSYQHWLLTPIIGLLFSIYLKLPHVHRNLEQVFQAVASQRVCSLSIKAMPPLTSNMKVWCPQLYLYSNADHLIPATQIEHVIQAQKEVGLPVFSVCVRRIYLKYINFLFSLSLSLSLFRNGGMIPLMLDISGSIQVNDLY